VFYWEEKMSSITKDSQENMLKWVTRYVLIPVSLAVITGLFAIEVIDREIASRNQTQQPEVDYAGVIFATLTAVAPQNQPEAAATPLPSRTPTAEPTPTEEARLETTPVVDLPADSVAGTIITAVCGQVPPGWRLYTVQPGNTLYSLARQTGTSVAAIRQVNCLGEQLMAFSQIWLPPFFAVATIVPTVDTPQDVTPTITVTEEVALPDLINTTDGWPIVSQNCSDSVESCVTTVTLAVSNVGSAGVDSFDVLVRLDPDQSVVLVDVVEGLGVGDTAVLSLSSPLGISCYNPDCSVCISVDNRGAITEVDESNNQYCTTFTSGVGGG
jgi:hypothetical protein